MNEILIILMQEINTSNTKQFRSERMQFNTLLQRFNTIEFWLNIFNKKNLRILSK